VKPEILKILYCGHEECAQGHAFGPVARSHYLIHFVLKGKGYYQVGDHIFTIEAGSAFLIKPYEVTFYKADLVMPWEYVWIACSGIEAERIFETIGLVGSQYVCKWDNMEHVKEYLFKIFYTYMDNIHNDDELLGWFYLIFSKMQKNTAESTQPDLDYFVKAERYIQHNYGYDIHITDISNYIGIDRTYLFKVFKKYIGTSPKDYLTAHRVNIAKDLLGHTELSVTEIAFSCGFRDSSTLCKVFSKNVGMTPTKYRKKIKEKFDSDRKNHCI